MPGRRTSNIKNKEQYEALLKQGMSKEKAARIANASDTSKAGGSSDKYENWTKNELYDKAKEVGIEGRSKMNKKQMIKALRKG